LPREIPKDFKKIDYGNSKDVFCNTNSKIANAEIKNNNNTNPVNTSSQEF
jgi:hypothetical protein